MPKVSVNRKTATAKDVILPIVVAAFGQSLKALAHYGFTQARPYIEQEADSLRPALVGLLDATDRQALQEALDRLFVEPAVPTPAPASEEAAK